MQNDISAAYTYQGEGDYEKALECFSALTTDPRFGATAMLEVGKTYKMMNRPAQAIASFIELLRRDPAREEAVKELGQTACLSSLYDDAAAALADIAARTGSFLPLLELSRINLQRNDLAAAEANLKAAAQLRPGDPDVRLGTARIDKRRGYLTKAAGELEKLLEAVPDSVEAWFELGDIYYQKGDLPRAIDYFTRITGRVSDKWAWLRLVELHWMNGDMKSSDEAAARALALTPDVPFDRDVILNEIEMLQRRTVLKSKMKRLWVTVTSRCNIRCKTCGLWHGKWDLPYKTAKEVMSYYPYLERLVWLGGEVFLYEHFEEMFDEAAKYPNLKQQVITNGVALTKNWMEKIVRASNAELTFSVDGVTKEVYEAIRQGSNFEKLLENIRLTMDARRRYGSKIDIRMNSVIMRTNYRQIEDLLEFAHREGFNQVSMMALHFDMAPEENIFYDAKDRDIMRYIGQVIPRLRQKAQEYGIDLDILLPPGEVDFDQAVQEKHERPGEPEAEQPAAAEPAPAADETPRPAEPQETLPPPDEARNPVKPLCCKMPWNYMMMCDKGDIYLTGSCVQKIGNASDSSLDEIWNSEMSQHYRQRMIDHRYDEEYCRTECLSRW